MSTSETIIAWYAFVAFIHFFIWLSILFLQKMNLKEILLESFSCSLGLIIVDPFLFLIGFFKLIQKIFAPTED